ncbi:MAG: hypothetical protein GY723_16340 [bacterium]|nr:hypothetical protein [bacterium]
MRPQEIPRLLRTLGYLRRSQWTGQLRRALLPASKPRHANGRKARLSGTMPTTPFLAPAAHIRTQGPLALELVGREVRWQAEIDWETHTEGPLWAYHLHQFDWVRHPALTPEERQHAMQAWCTTHTEGVGWAPFPISLRTFAWGKALATPGVLAAGHEVFAASLADQLATLSDCQETHILANHYLWNLLALVFGGVLLDGAESERWRGQVDRLLGELREQVPADGAHFERSPSYHALLLENLLDLLNIAADGEGRLPAASLRGLRDVAERMLGALALFALPDGEIALFGDSAFEIASTPASLQAYGEALGLGCRAPEPAGRLLQAGFARLDADPFTLIVSASPPAPSFQPGHAHCDALHFELCVGTERVITDTGVCEYVPGALRDAARATASHATVAIEGHEQAELWAAHRIGGRPDVAITRYEPAGLVEAVCAGWRTPEVLHTRRFELEPAGLTIRDHFDRPAHEACFHLPLGPGLEPQLKHGIARIPLASGRTLEITLPEGIEFRVEYGPYFPRFGSAGKRAFLRGTGHDLAEVRTTFRLS